jgi:hypothetical protein
VVAGPGPYTYQWQQDGVDVTEGGRISGSQTADMTITGTQVADSGDYTCIVSSFCGDITSDLAVINIKPVPDTGPVNHTISSWGN